MKKLILSLLTALSFSSQVDAYTVPQGVPDGRTSTGAVFYQPWVDFVDFMDNPCSTALRPANWNQQFVGYYYIDFVNGTDVGRTYGYPAAPRQTIPNPVSGPAYIELAAGIAYDQPHRGIGTDSTYLRLNGLDAVNYVCIAGGAGSTVTNSFHFRDSEFFIVDNITHIGASAGDNGVVWIGPDYYGVFRNGDISGDITGGGWDMFAGAEGVVQYAAILDTDVHDVGEWDAQDDTNDSHCGKISYGAFFVWILNGEHHHCGGDSVQIESRDPDDPIGDQNHNGYPEGARWIFIGGLEMHHNRQTGLWTKFGMDVVYAQNLCYEMRPQGESSGEVCYGGQYQPVRLWIIGNRAVNVRHGLRIASTDCVYVAFPGIQCSLGFKESTIYILGNLFDHQYTADGTGAAMSTWGGTQIVAAWNTIYDWDVGYDEPSLHNFGYRYILNNIFDTIRDEHITIEGNWAASHGALQGNVHKLPYLQRLEGTPTTISTPFSNANIRIVTDVMMTDPDNGSFGLQDDSPAIDFEPVALSGLVTEYETLYGESLAFDYIGNPRFNSISDAGILEKTGATPPQPKKRLRFRVQ